MTEEQQRIARLITHIGIIEPLLRSLIQIMDETERPHVSRMLRNTAHEHSLGLDPIYAAELSREIAEWIDNGAPPIPSWGNLS